MKCAQCGGWRSRLHRCVICSKRVCGCCAYKTRGGKRACSNSDDPDCATIQIRREAEARAAAAT